MGCPWDQEQNHHSLRFHAVEEVYELIDAIEMENDGEMREELGDLLLQVIFHCQLAHERKAFDFDTVCNELADKLVRRHPHVFGDKTIEDVEGVWTQWEAIKRSEKKGTLEEGIPPWMAFQGTFLPCSMRKKWLKKPAGSSSDNHLQAPSLPESADQFAEALLDQVIAAQAKGWSQKSC